MSMLVGNLSWTQWAKLTVLRWKLYMSRQWMCWQNLNNKKKSSRHFPNFFSLYLPVDSNHYVLAAEQPDYMSDMELAKQKLSDAGKVLLAHKYPVAITQQVNYPTVC
jgi:hypothetical protein